MNRIAIHVHDARWKGYAPLIRKTVRMVLKIELPSLRKQGSSLESGFLLSQE